MNSQSKVAWVYIRRCLTFGIKVKLKNIWGYARDFFFFEYSICSLYLVACTFAPISKFEPVPSKNPRCTPAQPRKQTIAIHILPNLSRTKGNQTIKFPQLIEYNMRNFHKMWWRN